MSVALELTSDEALVLMDLALRFTQSEKLEIAHHAERVAIWNLGCSLEKQCPEIFDENYSSLLESARSRLGDYERP